MIRHVVSWKLIGADAAARAEQAATITATLEALPALIPEILALQVGTNVAYPESNWDVVLIADYASLADLEAYQVHPDHVAATHVIKPLVASRSNVDFEV
ncbi:Dabb family protein [Conyzicola sp.]|uniref:Dabb family protein n=1 Tax=Conyzicola sp. TaxID=1969404 RepID=UPI00398A230D